MTLNEKFNIICEKIENELDKGYRKFVIYPFGINGMLVKDILINRYDLKDIIIVDNKLCKFRKDIIDIDEASYQNFNDISVLISIENIEIYDEIMNVFQAKMKNIPYVQLFPNKKNEEWQIKNKKTIIGKYSGGEGITNENYPFIKSIGAFCSFANGVTVVPNHPMNYISTHPFLYGANRIGEKECEEPFTYDMFNNQRWYFPGIEPKGACYAKRITIGNDVWLGRNVIITNYANIGDGVIAGAGSIITKDVPDFAVVVGAPARIIKYRFTAEQIKALKKIAWWNWEDEKIINNYDDFFLPIEKFIEKHL